MTSVPERDEPSYRSGRPDLEPAVVQAAMDRYLTPAHIKQLGDLFAMCVMAIAETRAAKQAATDAAVQDDQSEPAR